MRHMDDAGQRPEARRDKPDGAAGWKAHLQAIAQSNDRVKAAGKRERREREERQASERRAQEIRMDADLTRKLDSRYTN
jgi:hypothetical protein